MEYVREAHAKHYDHTNFLLRRQFYFQCLVYRQADHDNVHDNGDDTLTQRKSVQMEATVICVFSVPSIPKGRHGATLKRHHELEYNPDDDIQGYNNICRSSKSWGVTKDSKEEEAH